MFLNTYVLYLLALKLFLIYRHFQYVLAILFQLTSLYMWYLTHVSVTFGHNYRQVGLQKTLQQVLSNHTTTGIV